MGFLNEEGLGLDMDQAMQSSYSAAINLAHNAVLVKREPQPDETDTQPDVSFVDVDNVGVGPLVVVGELSEVSGQDVDPLMLPCQSWNSLTQDFPSFQESYHFKEEVVDSIHQESLEMPKCPAMCHGTLNAHQGFLSTSTEYGTSLNASGEPHRSAECDAVLASPDPPVGHVKKHSTNNSSDFKQGDGQHRSEEEVRASDVGAAKLTQGPDFTAYKQSHLIVKPYTCDICQARFAQRRYLTRHKITHTGVKPHSCDSCDARFTDSSTLARHKRFHSGLKPYICDICQARFAVTGHLTRHKITHTGVKPYSCDSCDARFTTSSDLARHKATHTGVKPYACETCQARFSQYVNLTIHIRTHSGEKPYVCDICEARFAQDSNLKSHMRTHTKIKPYTCDICEARFTQSGHLTIHFRTHTGVKPYVCDICQARFTQNGSLTRHKRTHFKDTVKLR